MNDRELLEMAAKAAGYKVYNGGKLFWIWKDSNIEWVDWNPLTDDGDALRLAVNLRLDIDHLKDGVNVWKDYIGTGFIQHGNDPYATTRLAIVRAAAEIGRNMK